MTLLRPANPVTEASGQKSGRRRLECITNGEEAAKWLLMKNPPLMVVPPSRALRERVRARAVEVAGALSKTRPLVPHELEIHA